MPAPNPYESLYMLADSKTRETCDPKIPDVSSKKPEALENYGRLLRELEKRPIEEPKQPSERPNLTVT